MCVWLLYFVFYFDAFKTWVFCISYHPCTWSIWSHYTTFPLHAFHSLSFSLSFKQTHIPISLSSLTFSHSSRQALTHHPLSLSLSPSFHLSLSLSLSLPDRHKHTILSLSLSLSLSPSFYLSLSLSQTGTHTLVHWLEAWHSWRCRWIDRRNVRWNSSMLLVCN